MRDKSVLCLLEFILISIYNEASNSHVDTNNGVQASENLRKHNMPIEYIRTPDWIETEYHRLNNKEIEEIIIGKYIYKNYRDGIRVNGRIPDKLSFAEFFFENGVFKRNNLIGRNVGPITGKYFIDFQALYVRHRHGNNREVYQTYLLFRNSAMRIFLLKSFEKFDEFPVQRGLELVSFEEIHK